MLLGVLWYAKASCAVTEGMQGGLTLHASRPACTNHSTHTHLGTCTNAHSQPCRWCPTAAQALGLKADREEVAALEGRQGARLASLEGAILKGLKAISDRVSAALAEKLDLTLFNEFKVQVGARSCRRC